MMYSPSDGFAWGLITEGSNQVLQSEILSISIRTGCELRHDFLVTPDGIDPCNSSRRRIDA
ncbi:hypothetical protein [uncultured Methanospirillum sp.]|uniref:hypothetical protein n=1 Tax=uncultured Methanospirillum sp. TaxID=262503 RepID=UPI0029C6E72B|nr:hypothetical protein [uncultured Methanospirillum sp.]